MPHPTPVDFWFDPSCPWAWLTSRWLLAAATVRDLEPRWHVMSLALLNEGEQYQPLLGPVRVCIAAQVRYGGEALLPLYTAMGTLAHVQRMGAGADMVVAALADAGLAPELAAAMTSTDHDDALRASHDDGMARVGRDVGTPVISFDGVSIFGPVISPAPKGEAAGQLWDAVALVTRTPGFFELKRSRTQPIFD